MDIFAFSYRRLFLKGVCCLFFLPALVFLEASFFTSSDFFKNQASVRDKVATLDTASSPYDTKLLSKSDIAPALNTLLDLHISVKQWNVDLLQKSILSYFEQFDPEKIYLLDSEVNSLFQRSSALWHKDLDALNGGDWAIFDRANQIIEQAIWRVRGWGDASLLRASLEESALAVNSSDLWAYSMEELKSKRSQFFQEQKNHLSSVVELSSLMSFIKEHENRYLFLDEKGKRLGSTMKEHAFASAVISSVAASLDAHSGFLGASASSSILLQLEKKYVGIGLWLQEGVLQTPVIERESVSGERFYYVGKILAGSPADISKKIVKGDRVLKVQGVDVSQKNLEEVQELLRGAEGEVVDLLIEKRQDPSSGVVNGAARQRVTLVRSWVELEAEDRVQVELRKVEDGVYARITLDAFYESEGGPSSAKDIERELLKIKKDHVLKGVILDLRGNTGGYLTQAVKVAGLFIPTGVVAIAKYSDESVQIWRDEDPVDWFDGPMLVLVSKMSASASEIVAQCLQDYGVALVIGDARTYGKGSIQFHNLSDSAAAHHYKVTVGKYYTVSGRTTQLEGVVTDLVVPGPYNDQMIGERYAKNALQADRLSSFYKDTLSDLDASDKVWYLKNYLPRVQKKVLFWRKTLDYLRKTSSERVSNFLDSMGNEEGDALGDKMYRFQEDEAFEVLGEMNQHIRLMDSHN